MAETPGVPPPTGPAPPKPLPSAAHPRSDKPSVQILRAWLPLYLHKADSTLLHLSRILSTPSGTDSLLTTLQYSTLATSALLSTLSLRRLHAQLLALLSLAHALPPNTPVLLTPPAPSSSAASAFPAPPLALRTARSLAALSALISDCRMFARLWGLLGIYRGARGLAAKQQEQPTEGAPDRVLDRIAWAQVSVGVVYQVLENGAYLATKGVLGWDAERRAAAWAWSSRCWMAHVGLELTRLAYLWSESESARVRGKGKEGDGVDGEGERKVAEAWRRDLISNAAYAPLTVHYSMNGGLVGDLWIGVLGTIAGGVGFAQVWKNTA